MTHRSATVVDMRSDTVTQPTEAMRRAMAEAEVGDDVYGEDPAVNALERETAQILGKEDAVFTPSGTMANQLAFMAHTRPGDSVICEEASHVFAYEAGAAAALSGVQFDLVPLAEGLSDEAVEARLRPPGLHNASSTLLIVENTHNRNGGRAWPSAKVGRIAAKGRALGLKLHCDGARLWNAAAATGEPESQLAREFDTVAVCYSKGLGAPVGSALAGPKETIERARKFRKRLGGGMRQAGIVAAGALHALRHHRARLGEDHRRAAHFAKGLSDLSADGRRVEVALPEIATNMVYWRCDGVDPDRLVEAMSEDGVLMFHVGGGWLRSVFHLQIDDAAVERALDAIRSRLSERTRRGKRS